jgi:Ca2+-binding RTX toxin-like protein
MEKLRRSLGIVAGGVALLALGVVSYIVLADIVCSSGVCAGTPGSDRIIVTSTNVYAVNAGDGNDRVTVASTITTNITINGGNGNDIIFDAGGGSSSTPLQGEAGNDIIYGNGGNDTINGGDGNDRIFGGAGDDVINGGPGNDIIDPGPGQDGTAAPTSFTNPRNATTGGGGNDIFILRRGESGGTEYILCTVGPSDRGLVKLIGYSRNDPALPWQELNVPLTDPNPTPINFTDIPDGSNRFRVYHGPGQCKIIVSSR